MEMFKDFVDATLGLFDIYIWYVILGVLIASWAFFQLAAATAGRKLFLAYLFGFLVFLGIAWLGFSSLYSSSGGFSSTLVISEAFIPGVMLLSQAIILIVIAVYRRKL